MNRILLPLLAACIGLGVWAAWEHIERKKLAGENSSLLDELAAAKKHTAARAVQELADRKKIAELEKQVATADLADGHKTGASSPKAKGPLKGMGEEMAKMFNDPKMRDVMKTQARMGIDMLYRDLYDLLNLPEPQRSQFEKLITEKASVGMEAAFAMMGGEKTAEEKKAASAEVKTKIDEVESKIKDLLAKEDYDKVKRYEDSQMERMQLKSFTGMLTSKDMALDEAAETKLMDAMYQEREKFPFASKFVDQQNPDISRFTPENGERFQEEYGQLNENIARRARSILSAPQLEVFRESQTQQMNMVKMQMEWGAKMFGGDKD